jgi:predicted RND superfamily exporter protein
MYKRLIILSLVVLLTIFFSVLIPSVKTNYDLTTYLPEDSKTNEGIETLENEFGVHSLIELQLNDVDIDEVIAIKMFLSDIEHVEQIIWLDNYVDLSLVPLSMIDESLKNAFYVDQKALLQISIGLDAYDLEVESVIEDITYEIRGLDYALRGEALVNIENRHIANQEVIKIMLLILPIVILIMIIASKSWIEPVILLISIGVAVLLNLGTNIFLPDVSYITQTMALALQLALSLDYGLFLMHRFYEEKEKTDDLNEAIRLSFRHAFPSITASALTTIAGFLSLLFMSYRIGFDIGIVLSKGILLSYLSTMILTPILIYFMYPLIKKTMHKHFLSPFGSYIKYISRLKYVIVALFIIVTIAGIYFSNQTEYLYGNNTSFDEDRTIMKDNQEISETFGSYQSMVILVPNDDIQNEIDLSSDLIDHPSIIDLTTLVTVADPSIPRSLLPESVVSEFVGDNYTRIVIKTNILEENESLYSFSDTLNQSIKTYYDDYHIVGMPESTAEIKDLVTQDRLMITFLSLLAIFVILCITFKSLLIPIVLVLVIQSAIWFNLSILYIQDTQTIFIGYLVVMAIQLGATIDYAVLMTHRYIEKRKTHHIFDAMDFSFKKSFITISISAFVLAIAGFIEGIFSNISAVKDIGFLLGKGALISYLFVLIALPALLMTLDKHLIHIHDKKKKRSN